MSMSEISGSSVFFLDNFLYSLQIKFPFILREIAAIWIRLRHASQGASSEAPAKGSVTRR